MAQASVQSVPVAAAASAFHPWAQAPKHGSADVVVKVIVNERVGTAIGKSKRAAHLHTQLGNHVRKTVRLLQESQKDCHKLEKIKGNPGDNKSCYYNGDNLDGFSQFLIMFPSSLIMHTESFGDGAVKG